MPPAKPTIAIATGDPAGIGPEISLKTALDPAVRAACNPILVSSANLLTQRAKACAIEARICPIERVAEADWAGNRVSVLECRAPDLDTIASGAVSAAAGRAALAFCTSAIEAAMEGAVDSVVAAPQNETSIAMAGIPFDGHPSLVARVTGTDPERVFMMLCFGQTNIAHATLHQSVRQAIDAVTPERVQRVIMTTDQTLRRMGIASPKIAVGGINPHAGEGGLFGREEIEIIKPQIDAAAAAGLDVVGPFGADTMFHMSGFDAFIVMLHDQGHIAAKLLAKHAAAALTIGTPILFSSVAHGSAHDIAGTGVADPAAMIEAVLRLARIPASPHPV